MFHYLVRPPFGVLASRFIVPYFSCNLKTFHVVVLQEVWPKYARIQETLYETYASLSFDTYFQAVSSNAGHRHSPSVATSSGPMRVASNGLPRSSPSLVHLVERQHCVFWYSITIKKKSKNLFQLNIK